MPTSPGAPAAPARWGGNREPSPGPPGEPTVRTCRKRASEADQNHLARHLRCHWVWRFSNSPVRFFGSLAVTNCQISSCTPRSRLVHTEKNSE